MLTRRCRYTLSYYLFATQLAKNWFGNAVLYEDSHFLLYCEALLSFKLASLYYISLRLASLCSIEQRTSLTFSASTSIRAHFVKSSFVQGSFSNFFTSRYLYTLYLKEYFKTHYSSVFLLILISLLIN